jgi:hypothetical protein
MPGTIDDIVKSDINSVEQIPSWFIRNGNALVLVFFITLVAMAFFNRYPVLIRLDLKFKPDNGQIVIVGESGRENMNKLKIGQDVSIRVLASNEIKELKLMGKVISEPGLFGNVCQFTIGLNRNHDSTLNRLFTSNRILEKSGLINVGTGNFLERIFGDLLSKKK